MSKLILITGATDGIGLRTAQMLVADGHQVLLHGRSPAKLEAAAQQVGTVAGSYVADFSDLGQVAEMANQILAQHQTLDVLINNAGVYRTPQTKTASGHDVRFVVNTFAAKLLTDLLLPLFPADGRIVNLSSAAQAPVDVWAMAGERSLADFDAYAQSKLALTIWTQQLSEHLTAGQVTVAVNPGSLLASKMVKEGLGVAGNDLDIGARVLCQAALDASFAGRSGAYFDNDIGQFNQPHPAAQDPSQVRDVIAALDNLAVAPG
ncbi:MAG: SDR family NAD(P)-dependent oxidoreductase [Pseudomonadota bacterium]